MGYLNKSTITVDAILTNRGRELLAQGTEAGQFNITKFAVADDEVDYRLYNTAHPLGSEHYGDIIENMPVLEATPDETQIMRYKLVTVTGTDATTAAVVIPQITNINYTSQTLYYSPASGQSAEISSLEPKTSYTGADPDGYTLILADGSLADVTVLTPNTGGVPVDVNSRGSVIAKGSVFKITARNKTGETTVSVFGNNSGATYNFTLSTVASA
jgi:hypothetical protein